MGDGDRDKTIQNTLRERQEEPGWRSRNASIRIVFANFRHKVVARITKKVNMEFIP
ncbi:MAG: hypothetical protein ACR9NN_00110 [Nostochopsis sp.]